MEADDLLNGNNEQDSSVIGYYKNGDPIHRHPSPEEIKNHMEEWWPFAKSVMSREQFETIDEMRNARLCTEFQRLTDKLTDDQIIEKSIQWWQLQWPWEVKPFFNQIDFMKQRLFNDKGFAATDKDKSMVLYGSIPDKVKSLCLTARRTFWMRDKGGKCKNIERFYNLCPKARISSYRGSA